MSWKLGNLLEATICRLNFWNLPVPSSLSRHFSSLSITHQLVAMEVEKGWCRTDIKDTRFRPISKLSILIKLLETIVLESMKNLLLEFYSINEFSFRLYSSTGLTHNSILEFVTSKLDDLSVCSTKSAIFTDVFVRQVYHNKVRPCYVPLLRSQDLNKAQCVKW